MKKHYKSLIILILCFSLVPSSNAFAITQAKPVSKVWNDGNQYYGKNPWKDSVEYYTTDPSTSNWKTISDNETIPLSQNKVIYTISSDKYINQTMFHLPWDLQLREAFPEFYKSGQYVDQGINSVDWHGTCGEAAIATVMNRIFRTNAYTENNVLAYSSLIKQCTIDSNKWNNGGQSPIQAVAVLNTIGDTTGDKVTAHYLVNENTLKALEVAKALESGKHIIMSVASCVLYDWTQQEALQHGATQYWASNHWLVVTEPKYNDAHELIGFYLVDSSGYNHQYVTLQKWNDMVFGPTGTEVLYPACIVVEPVDKTISNNATYVLDNNDHNLYQRKVG